MARRVGALFLSFLLGVPFAALAAPVTWLAQGHVTLVEDGFPLPVNVGDSFSVQLGFDTSAAVTGNPSPGKYFVDPSSVTMSVMLAAFGPYFFDYTGAGGSIIVRDNSAFPTPSDPLMDGYSFSLQNDGDYSINVQMIIRGSEDLGAVTSTALPATPDPRLLTLGTRVFEICRSTLGNAGSCDMGNLEGEIEVLSAVPEPTTTLLFVAGLSALALARRRLASRRP